LPMMATKPARPAAPFVASSLPVTMPLASRLGVPGNYCSSFPLHANSRCNLESSQVLTRGFGCRGQPPGPQAKHLALIGLQNFEAVASEVDFVRRCGNFAEGVAEQTGNGGYGLVGVVAKLNTQKVL